MSDTTKPENEQCEDCGLEHSHLDTISTDVSRAVTAVLEVTNNVHPAARAFALAIAFMGACAALEEDPERVLADVMAACAEGRKVRVAAGEA
jgi:hypothetical protein